MTCSRRRSTTAEEFPRCIREGKTDAGLKNKNASAFLHIFERVPGNTDAFLLSLLAGYDMSLSTDPCLYQACLFPAASMLVRIAARMKFSATAMIGGIATAAEPPSPAAMPTESALFCSQAVMIIA